MKTNSLTIILSFWLSLISEFVVGCLDGGVDVKFFVSVVRLVCAILASISWSFLFLVSWSIVELERKGDLDLNNSLDLCKMDLHALVACSK